MGVPAPPSGYREQSLGLCHSAYIPNALPRRYLRGFLFAEEWAKVVGYCSTESSLRKACLVRVRHCVAHRTLATALGLARCRHGNMFALSSVCWFSFLKIKYCCPIKLFWTGRKNQVWHLLQESAFWVTLLLPQTKTTMDKSIIFADSRSIVR